MKGRDKFKIAIIFVIILLLALTLSWAAPQPKGEAPKSVIPRNSPVPADAPSIEAGGKLFMENCLGCHGRRADGKGVVARNLDPKPRNLRNAQWIAAKSDGYLFRSITYGVPGTSMPPWGPVMKDNDRWNLINYLRSLTAAAKQPAGAEKGNRNM